MSTTPINHGVVHIAGPTGVGKSALAIEIAERIGAEIVGADAYQIYADLPILTAQPAAAEMGRVPHHLIGCIPPTEAFDAQRYAELARPILADIARRGRRALVVGGTGLYFRALIDGFAPTPPPDAGLRRELEDLDLDALVGRLEAADPAAPALVDCRNKRRVVRAIEIVEGSGRPLADFRSTPRMTATGLLVTRDREELRDRIAANVRQMLAMGAIEEVKALGDGVGPTAERAIGLKDIRAYIQGALSLDQCIERMTLETQRYAKRQLTWFRNQTTFKPLDLTGTQHWSAAVESALRALE